MKKYIKNKSYHKNRIQLFVSILTLVMVYQPSFCQNKIETVTPILSHTEIEQCKENIIQSGDWGAYLLLGHQRVSISMFPYAWVLACKYENGDAYYEVYRLITDFYNNNSLEIDTNTSSFLLMFLEKGASIGSRNCILELYQLYSTGTYVAKDMEKAEKYLRIKESLPKSKKE